MPAQLKVIQIRWFSGEDKTRGVWVGQVFDLVKDMMSIGRHSENDIPLFSFDRVRWHCLLVKEADDYFIEDISDRSRCIVSVNNAPILARTLLKDGDVIDVFHVRFVY